MNQILIYFAIIAATGIGILLTAKKFLKTHQTKEFNYQSKRTLKNLEDEPEKKFDFRKNRYKDNEALQKSSYRQSFSKATREAQSIQNVELNTTFWIALSVLVGIVLLIAFL